MSTDVVVVSYNSRNHLRDSVCRLANLDGVSVIVVDNASSDGSLETIADLSVNVIRRPDNAGFAAGCNVGWRAGRASNVLFLNPDASIDERSLETLVASLRSDASLGAVAPRIEHPDGTLAWSQRRFPRLRSTFAQGFFLHRIFPRQSWSDEIIRDPDAYADPGSPEWVSGACVLVRRAALEALAGWDERFFLYCEDIDLCKRLRDLGYGIRYEPRALVVHEEGASAGRAATLPLLAVSRVRYARKHRSTLYAALEQVGIAWASLTHVIVSRGGLTARAAHGRALIATLSPRTRTWPPG